MYVVATIFFSNVYLYPVDTFYPRFLANILCIQWSIPPPLYSLCCVKRYPP